MSPGCPNNSEALHSAMGCQPPFLSGPRCHWHTSELDTRKLNKTLYTLPIYIFSICKGPYAYTWVGFAPLCFALPAICGARSLGARKSVDLPSMHVSQDEPFLWPCSHFSIPYAYTILQREIQLTD